MNSMENKCCIEPAVGCICEYVGYVSNAKTNVAGMGGNLKSLNDMKGGVEEALDDVNLKNEEATRGVKLWSDDAAKLIRKVEDVEKKYEPIRRRRRLKNFIFLHTWKSIYECGSFAANFPAKARDLLNRAEPIVQNLNEVKEMDDTMKHVNTKKSDIESTLREAKRMNEQHKGEVKLWTKKVTKLEADMAAVHSLPSIQLCGSEAANLKREGRRVLQVGEAIEQNLKTMKEMDDTMADVDTKKSDLMCTLKDVMRSERPLEEVELWFEEVRKLEARVDDVHSLASIQSCDSTIANLQRQGEGVLQDGKAIEQNLKNIKDMNSITEHLRAKKSDTKNELESAKWSKKQATEEVELWLREAAKVIAKVDAINADYEQIGPVHPNQQASLHNCGNRAAQSRDEAEKLLQVRAVITTLTKPMEPDHVQHIPCSPNWIGEGIKQNLKKVLDYLNNEKVGVLGLWGPGGVGKTTLLTRINNSLTGAGNLGFEYVIWVTVSQTLQLEKIQKEIAQRLQLSSSSLVSDIFMFLQDKNFLLLLDDLWEGFDLEEIGIPQPLSNNDERQRKQKVILTTRLEEVCSCMQVDMAIKVECLQPDEALQLFRKAVGNIIISDSRIETLTQEVAKECDGLPIALKTIGKAMSKNKTVDQWLDALTTLQSHTRFIKGMDRVFARLKISFDCLEDDTEKECFLHCSLWPEDNIIYAKELIWCWLGHGLLDLEKLKTMEAVLNRGYSIIENLKAACLLEDMGSFDSTDHYKAVKMHDVIRDLAVYLTAKKGSKWITKVIQVNETNQATVEWNEADKVFFGIQIESSGRVRLQTSNCSNLSTLFLRCLGHSVTIEFSDFLLALRYLQLTIWQQLPAFIGRLSHLEYLSYQCLGISRLPDELGNLSNLKYLILSDMWSQFSIPTKMIVKLEALLVLEAASGGVLTVYRDPTKDDDAREFFMALDRMKFVSVQEIQISYLGALKLPSHVKVERLSISNSETEGQKTFNLRVLSRRMQQIKCLEIMDCISLEELVMDCSYSSLWWILLKNLPKLRKIAPISVLEVDTVNIENCPELRDVGWVLQLQGLQELRLSDCGGMECVIADARIPTFNLRLLKLHALPQLHGICDAAIRFPSLEMVQVFQCPELKTLPSSWERNGEEKEPAEDEPSDDSSAKPSLRIYGTQEWWNNLNLDDHIKSALQPHFEAKDEEMEEEESSAEEEESVEEEETA